MHTVFVEETQKFSLFCFLRNQKQFHELLTALVPTSNKQYTSIITRKTPVAYIGSS